MKPAIYAIIFATALPAFASPVDIVTEAFTKAEEVFAETNDETVQNQTSCKLVQQYVAVDRVANAVLGSHENEAQAVSEFKALLPSVLVTDFKKITDLFKFGIQIKPKPLVRGTDSQGVEMTIVISETPKNIQKYVVVTSLMDDGSWKITDLEFKNYGAKLVNVKSEQFAKIMAESTTAPVAHLVDTLNKNSDLVRCP